MSKEPWQLQVVVTLRPTFNDADRHGIAQAETELVSAAKATLNALNRFLTHIGDVD